MGTLTGAGAILGPLLVGGGNRVLLRASSRLLNAQPAFRFFELLSGPTGTLVHPGGLGSSFLHRSGRSST